MSVQFSYLKNRTSDLHEIVYARPCNVFVVLLALEIVGLLLLLCMLLVAVARLVRLGLSTH